MAASRDDPTTSEMRHDWLTDRWVIMAPQRTARPIDFVRQPTRVVGQEDCPFCHGHEAHTPIEVASYRHGPVCPGKPGWHVRVVPNKFPAVHSGGLDWCHLGNSFQSAGLKAVGAGQSVSAAREPKWLYPDPAAADADSADCVSMQSPELFRRRDLNGGHEVIIEGPDHLQSLSSLDPSITELVFRAYRDRLSYWLTERDMAYAVVFKNVGHEAGASLVHSHSQLIATNLLPTDVQRAAQRMDLFYAQQAECLICRTLHDEVSQRVRLVEVTDDFVAYCPFASRLPALVAVTSKQHRSRFEELDDEALGQLSSLVHRLIRRIEHCYPQAAYNYVLYTAPRGHQTSAAFHWRLEIFPRLSTLAGFEWGSECYINPLLPEDAASQLRSACV